MAQPYDAWVWMLDPPSTPVSAPAPAAPAPRDTTLEYTYTPSTPPIPGIGATQPVSGSTTVPIGNVTPPVSAPAPRPTPSAPPVTGKASVGAQVVGPLAGKKKSKAAIGLPRAPSVSGAPYEAPGGGFVSPHVDAPSQPEYEQGAVEGLPEGFYSAPEGWYYGGADTGWYLEVDEYGDPIPLEDEEWEDYYEEWGDEGWDGGGGGGGGGGSGGAGEGDVGDEEDWADPLGELAWWANKDSLQPLLRGWGSWMKELIEQNRFVRAVPNPFAFDAEAEEVAGEAATPAEGGKRTAQRLDALPAAGMETQKAMMQRLQGMLGVEFTPEDTTTTQWQKTINAIPQAGFEAQQMLASLRFNPDTDQWYSVDIGQLVNPAYI